MKWSCVFLFHCNVDFACLVLLYTLHCIVLINFIFEGFMPEMSIESTQPSALPSQIKAEGENIQTDKIAWKSEISTQRAYQILEREFYPFKEVSR